MSLVQKQKNNVIDPLGRPKRPVVIIIFIRVACPTVRTHFSNLANTIIFQMEILFDTSATVGLAKRIIGDLCLVLLIHSADPKSRPIVITNFALVVCTSIPTFQNLTKQNNFQVRSLWLCVWPSGSLMIDLCLVLSFFYFCGLG